jgi:hypothetical protein
MATSGWQSLVPNNRETIVAFQEWGRMVSTAVLLPSLRRIVLRRGQFFKAKVRCRKADAWAPSASYRNQLRPSVAFADRQHDDSIRLIALGRRDFQDDAIRILSEFHGRIVDQGMRCRDLAADWRQG